MVNRQLSKQAIRWPVSRDHIAGLGLELFVDAVFFTLAADQGLIISRAQAKLLLYGRKRE